MDEQEFKIAITTTADLAGVKKTTEALKDLGKTDVAINEASTKATDRATAAKKQFGDAVKGVANQIPALGTAMRMVTNPIATSVALITASIVILYKKLSDPEMSKVGQAKWGADEINKAAEAWKSFAVEISGAVTPSAQLAANLTQISTAMGLIDRLDQARNKQSNPLIAKAQAEMTSNAMRSKAAAARTEAGMLRAEAARTAPGGSAGKDAAIQSGLESDANQAVTEIAPLDAEIKGLEDKYTSENAWKNALIPDVGFALEYGAHKSPDEVLAVLRSQRSGLQRSVDLATAGKTRNEIRAGRRSASAAMLARASALDASASGMDTQAGELRLNSQVSYIESLSARGMMPSVSAGGSGASVNREAMDYFKRGEADLKEMSKVWAEAMARMLAEAKASNARAQNAP